MKVLWLCNIIPPIIAKKLNLPVSNKEGWISGLCDTVLKNSDENGISLFIASPVNNQIIPQKDLFFKEKFNFSNESLTFYGFEEDTQHPENYDTSLESSLSRIIQDCEPDLVHCFGTEYPHTLAMCRVFEPKRRLLIHIQGLCSVYANAYFADLPEKIIHSATLRDFLKKDSLMKQQQKFIRRGEYETEAVKIAGNLAGRTGWDQYYTHKWNPEAHYFKMYETLRPEFYEGTWQKDQCIPHSIFLSQGDYPIKGLHYMLEAMPKILKKFPDTKVYIAGNRITAYETIKDKLKISAYGKYLRSLILQHSLDEKIIFLGRLSAAEMKSQYLRSHLFVCCSSIENSPNSLGEAMMLGMPCAAANVGGIPDLFVKDRPAGIMYQGFECPENEYRFTGAFSDDQDGNLKKIAGNLSESVVFIWENDRKLSELCRTAREFAMENHNQEHNYADLIQIYNRIAGKT